MKPNTIYDKFFVQKYAEFYKTTTATVNQNKKIKVYTKKNRTMHKLNEQLNHLQDLKESKKIEYAMFPRFVLLMEIRELLQNIAYLKKKLQNGANGPHTT